MTGVLRHVLEPARDEPVDALAPFPDGRRLASAGSDGVDVWDARDGVRLHQLSDDDTITAWDVRVAGDGSWVAVADTLAVAVWDADTGALRHRVRLDGGYVYVVLPASDGSWLAFGDESGRIHLSDPSTGELIRTFTGHEAPVHTLVAAPDGSWLASGDQDDHLRLWDPRSGRLIAVVEPQAALAGDDGNPSVRALAVAPDGSWLAVAGPEGLRLVEPGRGTPRTFAGHEGGVNALAVPADGRWLASGSDDHTVRIWDPVDGTCLHTVTGHTGRVWALAAAPDGSWLASAGYDRSVQLWDTATGAPGPVLEGHTRGVLTLAAAPDGSWLASGGQDCAVRIWSPLDAFAQHANAATPPRPRLTGPVEALAADPAGTWLAAVVDRRIQLFDVDAPPAEPSEPACPSPGQVLYTAPPNDPHALGLAVPPRGRLSCSTDGRLMAARTSNTTIGLWEPATATLIGRLVASPHPRSGEIRALQIAPDGAWVAAGESGGLIRVWSTVDGTERFVRDDHDRFGTLGTVALAASADSRLLVSAGFDGVRAWDPDHGSQRAHFVDHHFHIDALAMVGSDSWLVALGGRGSVVVWDAQSRAQRAAYPLRACVTALAAPRNGQWLAAMSPVTRAVHILHPLTAGTGPVITVPEPSYLSTLAADPHGRWVAAASNGHVWAWDPVTALLLADHDLGHEIVDLAPLRHHLVAGGDLGPYLLPIHAPSPSQS